VVERAADLVFGCCVRFAPDADASVAAQVDVGEKQSELVACAGNGILTQRGLCQPLGWRRFGDTHGASLGLESASGGLALPSLGWPGNGVEERAGCRLDWRARRAGLPCSVDFAHLICVVQVTQIHRPRTPWP